MKKTNIRRIYYHIRHQYLTMNNVVVGIALIIGAGWAWGSIGMMQRNYELQKTIDAKLQQQKLGELEVDLLNYQKNYYSSNEYKDWAARKSFGLATPGEKVLILPANSPQAEAADASSNQPSTPEPSIAPSNFTQWVNFLFGGNRSAHS